MFVHLIVCHRGFEYDKEAGTCVSENQISTTITTYTDNALPEGSASSSDILTDDDSLGLDSDYSDR